MKLREVKSWWLNQNTLKENPNDLFSQREHYKCNRINKRKHGTKKIITRLKGKFPKQKVKKKM